jgi:Flp pilus assembly protein CpaB
VDVAEAGKLALAGQTGTLTLALRRPGYSNTDAVRTTVTGDLFSGRPVGPRVVPLRRRAPSAPAAPTEPAGSTIIVVNGAEPVAQRVPREGWGPGS